MPKSLEYIEILCRINRSCFEENMRCLEIIWNGKNKSTSCKLKLLCLNCGDISVKTYGNFISDRQGCKNCKYKEMANNQTLDESFVINEINRILENKELVFDSFEGGKYVSKKKTKVNIKCLKCGKITTTTYGEIYRRGINCRYCQNKEYNEKELTDMMKKRCDENNLDFIGFIKGGYKNSQNIITEVRCNKCGEEFSYHTHYLLNNNVKCKFCESRSKLELEMIKILNENNIEYIYQATKRDFPWLNKMSLDFYLPKYNVAIECQGKQHFVQTKFSDDFELIKERDIRKKNLCEENNIKIYYFSTYKNSPKTFLNEKLYNDSNNLINNILSIK